LNRPTILFLLRSDRSAYPGWWFQLAAPAAAVSVKASPASPASAPRDDQSAKYLPREQAGVAPPRAPDGLASSIALSGSAAGEEGDQGDHDSAEDDQG